MRDGAPIMAPGSTHRLELDDQLDRQSVAGLADDARGLLVAINLRAWCEDRIVVNAGAGCTQ
jgi:hypothetical protein